MSVVVELLDRVNGRIGRGIGAGVGAFDGRAARLGICTDRGRVGGSVVVIVAGVIIWAAGAHVARLRIRIVEALCSLHLLVELLDPFRKWFAPVGGLGSHCGMWQRRGCGADAAVHPAEVEQE